MSLSSSTNLNTLHIGDTFTVNVILSGLAPAETLNLLSATAQYTNSILSAPSAVTVGPIVPGGAANPDVSTSSGLNFAETDFQTFNTASASQIVANGMYFSFTMSATANGSGNIALTFLDALDGSPDDPAAPGITAGPALSFTVAPAVTVGPAAPLPAAWLSGFCCLAGMGFVVARRNTMAVR